MKIFWYGTALMIFVLTVTTSFAISKELVTIDDFVIQDTDFLERVRLIPFYERRKNIDKQRYLDKLIDEELFSREAKRLNLQDTELYKQRLKSVKREILVDLFLQWVWKKNTEANHRKYYEENPLKYMSPEQVRISVISVNSKDEAQSILKKARAGQDFGELAKKHSIDRMAKNGGDYGFRAKGATRKEFAEVVSSMKIGEIKDPVKTKTGHHIIKLTDRKEARVLDFESVRYKVSTDYGRKLVKDKISELRKAARIRINNGLLEELKVK